ncbi:TNF receptor-associated factor 6, partial [Halocaridina rubra]
LLSSAYKKINTFVSDLSRSAFGNFSRQPSLRSQISASSPIHENQVSPTYPEKNIEKSLAACSGSPFTEKHNFSTQHTFCADEGEDVSRLGIQFHQICTDDPVKCGTKSATTVTHQDMVLRDVSEKAVDLHQRMLEETIKLSNLTKRIEEVDSMVEDQVAEVRGKFCNGVYVWKIQNFSHVCFELQNKPGRVLHSPPFYTSQFGYKFCLRTNITWKCDEYFFTLFIHTMQGENDDILDWPFSGQIELSVLDCGPLQPKKHITETMTSKPDLQAFQRPSVCRNPKGFGFTEFVPLSKLLKPLEGFYVNNDCLFVRAIVKPEVHN